MSKVKAVLSLLAVLVCQVSGQTVAVREQLPAQLDPLGCTRPGGLPLILDPLRRCSTYVRGARLPIAVDPLGCTRPGPVPVLEDPNRLCSTYARPGARYPIAIDRYGLTAPGGISSGVTTFNQPTYANRPVAGTYRPTGPYNPSYPVQGGTYVNRPSQMSYVPTPMAPTYDVEKLPSIMEVQASVQNAQLTEQTAVQQIQTSAELAGRSISDSFERTKMDCQTALQTYNPTNAADVMGRITATIDNGRHAVNNALSNAQNNPTGSMADARNAAFITLAEVERTLRENGVPEDQAKLIIEKATMEVNTAIDQGIASQTSAVESNVAAKAQVKTTTESKIEEITAATNQDITNQFSNLNGQVKTVVVNPAKQKEIEDMLNRARNDIAVNMASAKSNPSSAAQVSRTTSHAVLNEIARMMRNEGVTQEVINQMIEPTRTNVINTINEAEYKIGTSVYEAAKVGVRV